MKKYIYLLIISLFLEVFVFNFSTWKSVGNMPIDLTDKMYCEGTNAYISGVDAKVTNLFIDTEVQPNAPIEYELDITDEGNYYEYPLGEGVIVSSVPASHYININAYGNVKDITLYFGDENQPNFEYLSVKANVNKPLFFNITRMLLVYLILVFLIAVSPKNKVSEIKFVDDVKTKQGRIMHLTAIGLVILWVIFGLYWSSSHLLFSEASKPHHEQYKELAVALKEGHAELSITPSPELLMVDNPYDTIYLQANGIDYKADYAFYNNKYYVYFGITPELLLYYPYYLLTGRGFPNHAATFVFYSLFVVGIFLLLKEIVLRYFKSVSYVAYLLIASGLVTCGSLTYLIFTADLYCVPVMAAMALTSVGLWLWMWAARRMTRVSEKVKKKAKIVDAILLILGSLSMALVVGCRPQMLLFSFLAIPIFWDVVIKKRLLFSKTTILSSILFCIPYVVAAIGIMYYNYIRFGSAFDFGATYSLTNNDMNLRGFSISRMFQGLWAFLFQIPYINNSFPFLHTVELKFDYMGKIVTEHYFGGIIACNVMTWSLFLIGYYKKVVKSKKLCLFMGIALGSSIIIGLLDANTAGVLVRYASDMSFGILLGSAVMLLLIIENASLSDKGYALGFSLIKVGFVLTIIYGLMVICNVDSGISLIKYNPELFYKIAWLFRF